MVNNWSGYIGKSYRRSIPTISWNGSHNSPTCHKTTPPFFIIIISKAKTWLIGWPSIKEWKLWSNAWIQERHLEKFEALCVFLWIATPVVLTFTSSSLTLSLSSWHLCELLCIATQCSFDIFKYCHLHHCWHYHFRLDICASSWHLWPFWELLLHFIGSISAQDQPKVYIVHSHKGCININQSASDWLISLISSLMWLTGVRSNHSNVNRLTGLCCDEVFVKK